MVDAPIGDGRGTHRRRCGRSRRGHALRAGVDRGSLENPGGTEDAAAEVAVGILQGLGASPRIVRSAAGRPSVVASIGSGRSPHPRVERSPRRRARRFARTWTSDPWEASVVDGRLIGRGAADMKGPVASRSEPLPRSSARARRSRGTLDIPPRRRRGGQRHRTGTKVLLRRGPPRPGCRDRRRADRPRVALAERGGAWITATARGRAAHGSAAAPRRQRDRRRCLDSCFDWKRCARARASPRRTSDRERGADRGRQRTERRSRSV